MSVWDKYHCILGQINMGKVFVIYTHQSKFIVLYFESSSFMNYHVSVVFSFICHVHVIV